MTTGDYFCEYCQRYTFRRHVNEEDHDQAPIIGKAPDNHVTDRMRELGMLPESLDPKKR